MNCLKRGPVVVAEPRMCVCGEYTTETDRAGDVQHHACTRRIKDTVARESRPYRTSERGCSRD